MENKASSSKSKPSQPIVSLTLKDGTIVETLYRPDENKTLFGIWRDGEYSEHPFINEGKRQLIPYSPENNLVQNKVVLLPSTIEEYESEEKLVAEIQEYLHRYVQVSPLFEKIAAYYALLSWVHDAFNELPYLRVRGDYGCGKTRFLLIAGAICYKPIFASGASTVSPIFRILDTFRGTLLLDESDFRFSDEKAELTKILNNGNARGFPVLRTDVAPSKELNPRAYHVFGPKIVASRGAFEDKALESRFLTEEMGQQPLRRDLPINLPNSAKEEGLLLRNKLLMFRLRTLAETRCIDEVPDREIEPRLNQILLPLLSLIRNADHREEILNLGRGYSRNIREERGMQVEAQVLEIIRDLSAAGEPLSIKAITHWFSDRHGEDCDRKVTSKWIGYIIRHRLALHPERGRNGFVIPSGHEKQLDHLYARYGIQPNGANAQEFAV
jgi:hypothetical protein